MLIQFSAEMKPLQLPEPEQLRTRTGWMIAPRATPKTVEAMVPATWVPWPSQSRTPLPSPTKSASAPTRPANSGVIQRETGVDDVDVDASAVDAGSGPVEAVGAVALVDAIHPPGHGGAPVLDAQRRLHCGVLDVEPAAGLLRSNADRPVFGNDEVRITVQALGFGGRHGHHSGVQRGEAVGDGSGQGAGGGRPGGADDQVVADLVGEGGRWGGQRHRCRERNGGGQDAGTSHGGAPCLGTRPAA